MAKLSLRKILLAAAAASVAAGAAAPAAASGGYHGRGHYAHGGWGHHHGYRGHYKRPKYYHGSRHYRRHHRGLSGGEAALLAAGIIGGVILIDRALENDRARDRYAEPYYAPPRGDSYYRRDDRAYPRYDDDYDYDYDDDLDDDLLGGRSGASYSGDGYNFGAAYNDCKAETRAAADDAGLFVALPAKPERIERIEGGAAVRFTASYIAQDRRGGEWRRIMTCEADEAGVRFLELA